MSALVQTSQQDGVLTVTLNRPEKKNALTVAMYEALVQALRGAVADKAVRVVTVQGSAGTFTAGNDLGDFMNQPPTGMDSPVIQFLLELSECPKPVLAAVCGPAVGIGVTMLLHCDMVWADPTARFRMPFVNLGLCPEGASSYLLPRLVGPARAAELLMLGDVFDAAAAEKMGLINSVVPAEQLHAHVAERARALAQRAPEALRATKDLVRRPMRDAIRRALKEEGDLFVARLGSDEAREALTAYFEKRAPDFSRLG
jgi:enoyl-CoA hydratase/carnithine racemase